MEKGERVDACVDAMQHMHAEGQDWLFGTDIARQMALEDVGYMRRYAFRSKLLHLVGVDRPAIPNGGLNAYPALLTLEREGIVEGSWEQTDETQRPRRQWRLAPRGQMDSLPPT